MKMATSTTATFQFLKETYGNKIKASKNSVSLQRGKGDSLTGAISISKTFARENNNGLSLEERMAVEQWLDYSSEIAGYENAGDRERIGVVLKDLNNFIKDGTYFVGTSLTIADVFLYHSLFPMIERLSFQEKEQFINLSRWFNHIQSDKTARQSLQPVKFLRTPLYSSIGRSH